MSDCLFCKIVAKEIPSTPVYEDEDVYAFLDIKPVNPGHVLVVPKKHCSGFLDCNPDVLPKWILATQKVARAVKEGLGVTGLNLGQNEGAVAGQIVPHLHIHVMPRHTDDGYRLWSGKPYGSAEEAKTIADKIKGALK